MKRNWFLLKPLMSTILPSVDPLTGTNFSMCTEAEVHNSGAGRQLADMLPVPSGCLAWLNICLICQWVREPRVSYSQWENTLLAPFLLFHCNNSSLLPSLDSPKHIFQLPSFPCRISFVWSCNVLPLCFWSLTVLTPTTTKLAIIRQKPV